MNIKKIISKVVAVLSTVVILSVGIPVYVHADMSAWNRGANITPTNTTEYGTASFDESITNLKATNANSVSFIVQLYQSTTKSSDIGPGWNTPTDESLIHAIQKAHSLGMSVAVKFHSDPKTGEWRAYVDPSDRNAWFAAYGKHLEHYARLAETNGVELLILGTEMIEVSSDTHNSTNTENWKALIANVRTVYSGKLSYAANWGTGWADEKNQVAFWDVLDYAGIDAYYTLGSNFNETSADAYRAYWDEWNRNDITPFQQRINKPIIFTEIGYKSTSGTHLEPGNYMIDNGFNAEEQANAYEALFSYWNDVSFMKGIYFWEWKPSPLDGGDGNRDYTPQNKLAQSVITNWFSGNGSAPVVAPVVPLELQNAPQVKATAVVSNGTYTPGQEVSITASIANTGGDLINGIIDVEVYDTAGTKVYQKYFEKQNISANTAQKYPVVWNTDIRGDYTVKVGVFKFDWSLMYDWSGPAATFKIADVATPTPSAVGFSVQSNVALPTVNTNTNQSIAVDVTNNGTAVGSSIVDIEIYNSANQKVFQEFTESQSFGSGEKKQYQVSWQTDVPDAYRVAVGIFASGWSQNYIWRDSTATFKVEKLIAPVPTPVVPAPTPAPVPPPAPVIVPTPVAPAPTPVSTSRAINVWWPTTDSTIGGTLPFKAVVENLSVDQYEMYWRVDTGQDNWMYSTPQDYPHKETWVDLSGWKWKGSGPYTLTFTARDNAGAVIATKSITIHVQH
ncbi:MAG: hypothetical protein Q7K40_04440 [bacterium]|nr:hypothetical protein [bacterium]